MRTVQEETKELRESLIKEGGFKKVIVNLFERTKELENELFLFSRSAEEVLSSPSTDALNGLRKRIKDAQLQKLKGMKFLVEAMEEMQKELK